VTGLAKTAGRRRLGSVRHATFWRALKESADHERTSDAARKILDLPVGLDATGMRQEFDSLGKVEVTADRYWGAQTQRSLEHFNIGHDRMPKGGVPRLRVYEEGGGGGEYPGGPAAGLEGPADRAGV
jgi:hypothetical protein